MQSILGSGDTILSSRVRVFFVTLFRTLLFYRKWKRGNESLNCLINILDQKIVFRVQ